MKGVKNYSYSSEQAIEETIINNATTINNKKVKLYIEKAVKRVIDIIAGLVGTILLIPITIGIYIARKMLKEDDGPIFYDQLRIGKGGKYFKLYKYRSMVIGADDKLKEYLAENEEAREEYSKYKKLKKDPRITKLGNFLRKTSLDEFPQFINVLKGDMSLVGPRPYLPREKEDMGIYYNDIVKTKPGLTGLWQVSGRSNTTFEERLKIEQEYSSTCGFKTDIKIFFKTFGVVLKHRGAK